MSAAQLLCALAVVASPRWAAMDPAQRAQAIAELRAAPWPGRLAVAAGGFLDTPYATSPLGEGEGPDPDPLLRLDAVDCLTMVEQSLALAATPSDDALIPTLNRLRYTGSPSYERRNHVMEAQWVPHLLHEGRLRDVTRTYGGPATVRVKKVITEASWKGKVGRALNLPPEAQVKGTFEFDLIPASAAVAALERAPDGLIVAVVRAERSSVVTRVSHVAVLVRGARGPLLRHASSLAQRVVDEPLPAFIKRNDKASWPLVGFAVYEPLESSEPDAGE